MKAIRIKLITTDKTLLSWRTLKAKLAAIQAELDQIENGTVSLEIEHRNIVPTVKDGRITHEWMDGLSRPLLDEGYTFVGLHMSDAQRTKWGVKPSLNGSFNRDYDLIQEFYLWADEHTRRVRFNQFIQTFIHEFLHGFNQGAGLEDDTHELHADGDIRGACAGKDWDDFDLTRRNQEKQVSILRRVIAMLQIKRPSLLTAATKRLGTDASPKDLAPDTIGCAESVTNIIRDVLPDFPIITGTASLKARLDTDPRFRRSEVATPGTIILSPTGSSTSKKVTNGHVGIIGQFGIMSNDSATGKWEQNYTATTWRQRWGDNGYETYYYQLI
ncbi:hypothetical protein [Tsuneonella sp. HG222]